MLRKIYRKLVLIRKELQNIRGVMESNLKVAVNSKNFTEAVQKAIRDNV